MLYKIRSVILTVNWRFISDEGNLLVDALLFEDKRHGLNGRHPTVWCFSIIVTYIYSPTKVKHHLTCFNNIFSNNELISNRFAVFITCTHILNNLWNRLLIDFYLCVYDRVCKVPRILFNICVCERKLIFFCVEF
jgi:hypothetical protein